MKKYWFCCLFFFINMSTYAALHELHNNLILLVNKLKKLEQALDRENETFQQDRATSLKVQEKRDQKERERREKLNRQLLEEKERLEQEQKKYAHLEQERINREVQEPLVQEQMEGAVKTKYQEELKLLKKRERQEAKKRRIEEQKQIEFGKKAKEEGIQIVERKEAIEQLKEQAKLFPYTRLTAALYSSDGRSNHNNYWLSQLTKQLNLQGEIYAMFKSGYNFISSSDLMRPINLEIERAAGVIKGYHFHKLSGKEKKDAKKNLKKKRSYLAEQFKIHLMPKNANDLLIILEQLLIALRNNLALQETISAMKYQYPFDFEKNPEALREKLIKKAGNIETVMPIVVIYPTLGKNQAQFLLNAVYILFKNMKGLDLTPRYNQKITSLIYYAQGGGDDKMPGSISIDFFTPDRIFYRPDFVSKSHPQDYSLKNPAEIY